MTGGTLPGWLAEESGSRTVGQGGERVSLAVTLGKSKGMMGCIEHPFYGRHCVGRRPGRCPVLMLTAPRPACHSPWALRYLVPDHSAAGAELLQMRVICPQTHHFFLSVTWLMAIASLGLCLFLLWGWHCLRRMLPFTFILTLMKL